MHVESGGTNSSLDLNFDFRTSGSCFDFSHELGFDYPYNLDIEIPIVETNGDGIDSSLEDLERSYIKFGDSNFGEFCDLNIILKNIDIQTRTPKFKKFKK